MLANNGLISEEQTDIENVERGSVSGSITEIRSAVMGGDSFYFLRLAGGDVYYRISASACELAVILNVGDDVRIDFNAGEGSILEAVGVERIAVAAADQPEETA